MKRKATINNPYHLHHSAPGGRKKVQEAVGVSDTVKINRYAEGTQIFTSGVSEPEGEEYEIEIEIDPGTLTFLLVSALAVLAECFLSR